MIRIPAPKTAIRTGIGLSTGTELPINDRAHSTNVHLVETAEQIDACFECMHELRPHLDAGSFRQRIRSMQTQGYFLAYVEEGGRVAGVAGYRYLDMLHAGQSLYVDDLVVPESVRSTGLGTVLIDWLRDEAIRNGCETLHLDSGVQRHRAHKFYFDRGMHIASFHFAQSLRPARS